MESWLRAESSQSDSRAAAPRLAPHLAQGTRSQSMHRKAESRDSHQLLSGASCISSHTREGTGHPHFFNTFRVLYSEEKGSCILNR